MHCLVADSCSVTSGYAADLLSRHLQQRFGAALGSFTYGHTDVDEQQTVLHAHLRGCIQGLCSDRSTTYQPRCWLPSQVWCALWMRASASERLRVNCVRACHTARTHGARTHGIANTSCACCWLDQHVYGCQEVLASCLRN